MLVGCVLVNRTRWAQAKSVHAHLVRRYGSAPKLADADIGYLTNVLLPLGLSTARARSLIDLAKIWRRFGGGWHRRHYRAEDILKLPGCGRYAADSWAIFIEGRRDVRPTDKRLLYFLREEKRRMRT